MAKNKEKILKKQFEYDGSNNDFSFQLKKKPNLWWLLLLLLPLVLLIPLKKDVTVFTRFDGNPEPFVDVSMSYTARYLLWDKKFNVTVPYDTIQQTDSTGCTVFKDLGYSVYSFIFHHKSPIVLSAGGDCFDSITESHRFHTTRKVVLDMQPKLVDVRLKVVDLELGFEIPGALVECEFIGKDGSQQMSDTTDAAGCIVVKDARLCGGFNSIKVSAEGYADTLQTDLQVTDLLKQAGGYVIPLRPLKERVIFFVKNVYSKEPIPDVLAEITLTLPGQQKTTDQTPTNVDGLGQGFFDEARVLAALAIKASKRGYYDSVYVAPQGQPNPLLVKDFVKLDSVDRVVWLRPKPHTEQFRNVDTLSGQPIKGVRNEIVINSIDGTTRPAVVAISNSNGYFDVTALPGDKITIVSTLDPYYHPKTTVIEKFEKAEIIYMRPVLVSVHFRTMEMVDGSIIGLLPQCDLSITVDGKSVTPNNSGDGNFTVPNLRLNSTISIVASKQYYNTNRTKVKNRNVYDLYKGSQDARDIPLDIERICGKMFSSQDYSNQMRIPHLHILGKPSGRFKFMFRTREEPDELEVWNCRPEDISTADPKKCLLFKWTYTDGDGYGRTPEGYFMGSLTPGWGTETRWLNYSNGPYITVVGIRHSETSNFDYVVCCQGDDCDVDW